MYTIYMYIYIYILYVRPHFSSPGTQLCKMGGV